MFDTGLFWSLVLVSTALSYLLPKGAKRTRACLLILVSFLVLYELAMLDWKLILVLIASYLWIAIGVRLTSGFGVRNPFKASFIVVLPVLLLWMWGKQATALNLAHFRFLYFVGFSFFLVKAWTFIKDFHDGRTGKVDPVVLAAYFFYFPTYVSGPMHLFNEFDQTIQNRKAIDGKSFIDVLFRLLLGMVKIKVIAPMFAPVSLVALANGAGSTGQLVLASFAYSIVIWADFSGYCDLAISTSRLTGLETPENFNYPYLATNLREFWQRWHITFSRVLTSYIFVPLSRMLQAALGDRRRLIMVIAYLVTFGFCGYWHGPSSNFTMWGAYHAAGLIISDFYRPSAAKRRLKRRSNSKLKYAEPFIQALCIIGTFAYVSLGWILFVLPLSTILKHR